MNVRVELTEYDDLNARRTKGTTMLQGDAEWTYTYGNKPIPIGGFTHKMVVWEGGGCPCEVHLHIK